MEVVTTYTDVEQQLVVSSALKKTEEKLYTNKVLEKHFAIRTVSLQHCFLRLSANRKRELIIKFVKRLKSPASIYQIFSVMSLGHAKMDVYSIVDPETNFLHDKLILDHNRMLDKRTLEETIKNDLDWFGTLDDYQQINLTLGLIRISGGNVKRYLYIPLYRIYRKTLCELYSKHFGSYLSTKSMFFAILEPEQDDPQLYDPKHPASIEVEKQRKRWFDLITKYKNEIMRGSTTEVDKTKKTKDDKTKKEAKKSKKEKNKGKRKQFVDDVGAFKQIDLIQLLPIWIVKKIFGHFNSKDLAKFKQVNSYWSFVISELVKERNARQKIDAALEKMRAAMDPSLLQKAEQIPEEHQVKAVGKKVFYELGAVDEKIIPKKLKGLVDTAIDTNAMKGRAEEYNLITGEWVHFPRYIQEDLELYRFRPGFLQDVGISYDVLEDIERQKSYLTYSLSKSVSSLKINLTSELLNDW